MNNTLTRIPPPPLPLFSTRSLTASDGCARLSYMSCATLLPGCLTAAIANAAQHTGGTSNYGRSVRDRRIRNVDDLTSATAIKSTKSMSTGARDADK